MPIASVDAHSDPALAATSPVTEGRARAGIDKVGGLALRGSGLALDELIGEALDGSNHRCQNALPVVLPLAILHAARQARRR